MYCAFPYQMVDKKIDYDSVESDCAELRVRLLMEDDLDTEEEETDPQLKPESLEILRLRGRSEGLREIL